MKKFAKLGLIVLAFLFLVPFSAKGAERTGIQISPLTYNFEIKDSDNTTGKIIVTNLNNEPLNYVIEVENFASVSESGAPSFAGVENEASITTLADWFTFDAPKEGTLAPHTDITINFTISIPTGAEPGGHYAAVFAREVKKNAEGKTELGVASRVGTLILVSVPGATTKGAEITEFVYPKYIWKGPVDFSMKVKNTGSIHYDSKGTLSLKPLIGSTREVDLGTHTIVPKSIRSYSAQWQNKYPIGRYILTASALDGNGQEITISGVIWALPIVIVIPAIIGLILLILIIRYLRKHIRFTSGNSSSGTTGTNVTGGTNVTNGVNSGSSSESNMTNTTSGTNDTSQPNENNQINNPPN